MLFLKIAAAAFAVLLVVSLISGRMMVSRMESELEAATQKVEQQKEKNDELSALLNNGDENAKIERIAREKLGYARPGERIFVDITGE
ncbi:MAG: FtsB family cell division protein [Oscillospiraceae bacterium]